MCTTFFFPSNRRYKKKHVATKYQNSVQRVPHVKEEVRHYCRFLKCATNGQNSNFFKKICCMCEYGKNELWDREKSTLITLPFMNPF